MAYIGWLLFLLSICWHVSSMNFNHRKRLHLNYLIVYLLLSDEIRDAMGQRFREWIHGSDAANAQRLSLTAYVAIEKRADEFASGDPGSALGAHALIWMCKQNAKINVAAPATPTEDS